MSNISHIKGAGGAMRKVPREFTDAELLRDVRRQAMPQTEQVIDTSLEKSVVITLSTGK